MMKETRTAWLMMAAVMLGALAADRDTRQAVVRPAFAAMPVIDASNIAHTSLTASRLGQQLAEVQKIFTNLKKQLTELSGMHSSFGLKGPVGGDIKELFAFGGSLDVLGTTRSYGPLAPDLDDVAEIAEQLLGKPPAAKPRFQTLDAAQKFTSQMLHPDEVVGRAGTDNVAARRRAVYQEAVLSATAVALHNRDSAAANADRVKKLAKTVGAAKTEREASAGRTAVLLAVLESLEATRALQASALNIAAAERLQNLPIRVGAGALSPGGAPSQTLLFTPKK